EPLLSRVGSALLRFALHALRLALQDRFDVLVNDADCAREIEQASVLRGSAESWRTGWSEGGPRVGYGCDVGLLEVFDLLPRHHSPPPASDGAVRPLPPLCAFFCARATAM